jgi:putative sterol carrier protein
MPDVYSAEWYEAVREAINERARTLRRVPEGRFLVAVEIEGDGASPYVPRGGVRRFVLEIVEGTCTWYRELAVGEDERALAGRRVDYRFRGPASVFDAIAAGELDPIDAALRGTIAVRGDLRLLLREAEQVQALLEAYTTGVETTWPRGRPPYGGGEEARAAGAEGSAAGA